MHDPLSVAHEIKSPFKTGTNYKYNKSLITIWHKDPCSDGTDDSCGHFIRARHIDKSIIEKVRKEFEFNFKHNYWFNEGGYPKFSVMGTVLEMYSKAAWIILMHQNNDKPDRKSHRKFMNKHLYDILHFAENPTDCIGDTVTMKFGVVKDEERIDDFVNIIVADIIGRQRKWYQHPKWHIHHWRIQFNFYRDIKRKYWDKCCVCGKRGFKNGSAIGNWDGTKRWHEQCDPDVAVAVEGNK